MAPPVRQYDGDVCQPMAAFLSLPAPFGRPRTGVEHTEFDPYRIVPTGNAHLDNLRIDANFEELNAIGGLDALGGNVAFGVHQFWRYERDPLRGLLREVRARLYPDEPVAPIQMTPDSLVEWLRMKALTMGIGRPFNDTTLYYYPHADPLAGFPEIASDANAVVIAFGGSGVVTATGRNFMQSAVSLRGYGTSLVSMDYPFHSCGPNDPAFMDVWEVADAMVGIIDHFESSGRPIYLVGHSMGPTIIQAVLTLRPDIAKGVIMFSPTAAITPGLYAHYKAQLESGALDAIAGRMLKVHLPGETWETSIDQGVLSMPMDRMKTQTPVLIVAGDNDPWSTPALLEDLARRYPNGRLEIISGAGHNLFYSEARMLVDRIASFIFQTEGLGTPSPKKAPIHPSSRVLYFYENTGVFREWYWATQRGTPLGAYLRDEKAALGLMKAFGSWFFEAVRKFSGEFFANAPPELQTPKVKAALDLTANPKFNETDCCSTISAIREVADSMSARGVPTPPKGQAGFNTLFGDTLLLPVDFMQWTTNVIPDSAKRIATNITRGGATMYMGQLGADVIDALRSGDWTAFQKKTITGEVRDLGGLMIGGEGGRALTSAAVKNSMMSSWWKGVATHAGSLAGGVTLLNMLRTGELRLEELPKNLALAMGASTLMRLATTAMSQSRALCSAADLLKLSKAGKATFFGGVLNSVAEFTLMREIERQVVRAANQPSIDQVKTYITQLVQADVILQQMRQAGEPVDAKIADAVQTQLQQLSKQLETMPDIDEQIANAKLAQEKLEIVDGKNLAIANGAPASEADWKMKQALRRKEREHAFNLASIRKELSQKTPESLWTSQEFQPEESGVSLPGNTNSTDLQSTPPRPIHATLANSWSQLAKQLADYLAQRQSDEVLLAMN